LSFEFSPLISAFKLPLDYKKRNLRIVVLNPEGKMIHSIPVPKKKKKKREEKKMQQNLYLSLTAFKKRRIICL